MITPLRVLSGLAIVGAIALGSDRTLAQITPDNTLGEERSVVTPEVIQGKPSDRIDGGATRDANLFHSFQEFNVDEGRGAYFSNPDGVENILSRVTGGSRSEILGALGVLGQADLFLINPSGILFGPNASLDVEGSFVGTTADGIGFGEQGFFSATDPKIPSQLLTVNPLAFFFNQVATQPNNAIENQGFLSVPSGQSLLLVGGKVSPTIDSTGTILVDGGFLQAPGGRVELGGLAAAGTIELGGEDSEWQLNFPQEVARADVALVNGARVDVSAGDGGSIAINARNLNILEGSQLRAGIAFGLGSPQAQAGDIVIQVTGTMSLANLSFVANRVEPEAEGKGGRIEVTTGSLSVAEGAILSASILGQGDAGSIIINASESVSFVGESSIGSPSGAFSTVGAGAEGKGGGIEITTNSLSVADGAQLVASTFGQGEAGSITINASESVSFLGESSIGSPSGAFSTVEAGAEGKAGGIEITTNSLSVADGAILSASILGQGDAGSIIIDASESVSFVGESSVGSPSAAFSTVEAGAEGKGGGIEITTSSLSVADGAQLVASTFGQGEAGSITINASENVSFVGESSDSSLLSGAFSTVEAGAKGKGSGIEITTSYLSVADGAQLSTSTRGQGDAGSIIINASESVSFVGESSIGSPSGAFSRVNAGAEGKAGGIEITTSSLLVADGAQLSAGTFGQGEAGSIIIDASESASFVGQSSNGDPSGTFSTVEAGAEGKAGGIEITTNSLSVADGAILSASTRGQGIGGEIQVSSNFLSLINGAQIVSRSFGPENSGEIAIEVLGTLQFEDSQISTSSAQAAGGAISITAADIRLHGDSNIRTEVGNGAGGGGDITLAADSILAFDDSDILAFARDGRGGNITLDTPVFFGSRFQPAPQGTAPETLDDNNRVDINASGAVSGEISLPDVSFVQNSLTELTESTIDTETLIADSCVVPSGGQRGTFIITGAGGLPVRPGDAAVSPYPTGTVRSVPNAESSLPGATRPWQKGDPIVEPTGTYRLANGKLVMSRQCSQR